METVQPTLSLLFQIATGVGLAACAGLRAFLPLFAVGLAGRLDVLPLTPAFDWLASDAALIVFGIAVLVELLGDKIPIVDHVLDAIQTLIKPIAGTAVVAASLTDLTPLQATVLGLLLGGSVAGVVHLVKAKTRLLSTATTAGLGNPVVSAVEDSGAVAGSAVALLAPPVMLALLALGVAAIAWWALRRRDRPRAVPPAAR